MCEKPSISNIFELKYRVFESKSKVPDRNTFSFETQSFLKHKIQCKYEVFQKYVTIVFHKYNMGNIFLEKSYTKCGGEVSPRPYSTRGGML